jgi:hypothetical protein
MICTRVIKPMFTGNVDDLPNMGAYGIAVDPKAVRGSEAAPVLLDKDRPSASKGSVKSCPQKRECHPFIELFVTGC